MIAAKNLYREQNLETGEPDPVEQVEAREHGVLLGSILMFVITMALFFLPVVNGIIGGVIGGHKVGHTKNAIIAAIVPAMGVGFLLWIALKVANIPVMGVPPSDPELALLVVLSDLGLLVGAAIGGTLAQNRIDRFNRA